MDTLRDEEDGTWNSSSKLFLFLMYNILGDRQKIGIEQRFDLSFRDMQNRLLLMESNGFWHLGLPFRSGLGAA